MKLPIPIFHRILHAFYYRGAAVQFWFGRRIRAAGIAALASVCFATFLTIGQPKESIFLLFCFTLGLVSLSFLWVVFRKGKLSASHHLPAHATVGEPLRYSVLVKNIGKRKIHGFSLRQTPPDPRPSLEEFSRMKEPGEEKRNLFDRIMIYYRWQWLMSRKQGFSALESEAVPDLATNESKRIAMVLTAHRRGVMAMHEIRALLPDPLGFFQKCISVKSNRTRLVVLPKRYRLPTITMPGESAFRIGGEETSNAIGNAGEFVGLREYRPGDPMRQIHWKSWAHTGKPMVKELEDSFYPRYGLILDTFPGSPSSVIFEEMISVAASFIVGLDRSESLLDLMFIADKAHMVTAGRDMERAEKLLEVLAGVKQETELRFKDLAETVIRHSEAMTSCLLVLNGWDSHRADFVKKLLKSGIICVPLVIGEGGRPEGLRGQWITSGEIQRDLLRLPAALSAATL